MTQKFLNVCSGKTLAHLEICIRMILTSLFILTKSKKANNINALSNMILKGRIKPWKSPHRQGQTLFAKFKKIKNEQSFIYTHTHGEREYLIMEVRK